MDFKNTIQYHFRGNYFQFYEKYLPKAKRIGGQEYQALCPFHDDSKPSFNFSNETGLFYCHACAEKGDIFSFYAGIKGLKNRDEFPRVLKDICADFAIPYEGEEKLLVKTYDYRDSEGNLLFQVCRYEPKTFKQRRPDGNGEWIWDLKGVETVLYRLPNVLKSQKILIVEGEKGRGK